MKNFHNHLLDDTPTATSSPFHIFCGRSSVRIVVLLLFVDDAFCPLRAAHITPCAICRRSTMSLACESISLRSTETLWISSLKAQPHRNTPLYESQRSHRILPFMYLSNILEGITHSRFPSPLILAVIELYKKRWIL
jgi:hypothetical protein